MQTSQLGRTGLTVSRYCLGSMTWGGPTALEDAHEQLDVALDHGLNFVDTAEVYPVAPAKAETVGRTERILGLWFDKTNRRSDVILATKQCGAGQKVVRGGAPITPRTIKDAIEGSLRRLKTDYIDLFQFHWPNRDSYHERRIWTYDPSGQTPSSVIQNMDDCLGALAQEVKRGTIRHFGLSNETAWGMGQWLRLAEAGKGPRPVTIQNEYSLLCRQFDTDLAEYSLNENVGLMAYAPLAMGLLTGKYQGHAKPKNTRSKLLPDLGQRRTQRAYAAVDDYLDVAFKHDLDMVGMALAFVASRPFVTSTVFGASDADQLARILEHSDLTLSDDVLADLNAVHRAHPMPF